MWTDLLESFRVDDKPMTICLSRRAFTGRVVAVEAETVAMIVQEGRTLRRYVIALSAIEAIGEDH